MRRAADPSLAVLMAASVRSHIATGPDAGQPWRRLGDQVEVPPLRFAVLFGAAAALILPWVASGYQPFIYFQF